MAAIAAPAAFSQRYLAVFAVGEARLLEVEVALDPPPAFVGDLAVAQQRVNELPLGRDQLARQGGACRRNVMRIGVERIRQLVGADFMPGPRSEERRVGKEGRCR